MNKEKENFDSITQSLVVSKKTENLKSKELIKIDDGARLKIFLCLTLIIIVSSCDGGIIPQQNANIKQDFGNDETRVGLYGSIDYLGRAFSALIFSMIMGKMNRKLLLIGTLIFKSIILFIPLFTTNYYFNLFLRCVSGISQVFFNTYSPVWCDQYGKKDKRTIMVMIIDVANPVGNVIGYGMGMLCEVIVSGDFHAWRLAYFFEGIFLLICALIIFLFGNTYFSEKLILIEDNLGKEEEPKETNTKTRIFSNITSILCNKIFVFSTLSISVAYFGMGVIQYYGDKYMDKVLKIKNPYRFILFGMLDLLGPSVGMLFGGMFSSKLGGYVKIEAMQFVLVSVSLSTIISCLIACHENKVLFAVTALCYLFFLCASIPPVSGIIISCLDYKLRGDGFSLSNFMLNLLGCFPSSYVYSLICDLFNHDAPGEDDPDKYRYAYMVSMLYNFVGLLFISLSGVYRCKIPGDLSSGDENDKKEVDEKKNDEVKNDEKKKDEEKKDEEKKDEVKKDEEKKDEEKNDEEKKV